MHKIDSFEYVCKSVLDHQVRTAKSIQVSKIRICQSEILEVTSSVQIAVFHLYFQRTLKSRHNTKIIES